MPSTPEYQLFYWPGIPGRGEFVRLAFEEAGIPYADTATEPGGAAKVVAQISTDNKGSGDNPPPLAPPILQHGEVVISQTSNILLHLGQELGLAPKDTAGMLRVNALTLTILDGLCNEPHECHHPIAVSKYYEDQKLPAKARAADFISTRLPKFLSYFERVLQNNKHGSAWLYGDKLTYADLVLFQAVDGVRFMFPKATANLADKYPLVAKLCDAVKERDNIKKYLATDRRQKYSNGIYRYYEELDQEP